MPLARRINTQIFRTPTIMAGTDWRECGDGRLVPDLAARVSGYTCKSMAVWVLGNGGEVFEKSRPRTPSQGGVVSTRETEQILRLSRRALISDCYRARVRLPGVSPLHKCRAWFEFALPLWPSISLYHHLAGVTEVQGYLNGSCVLGRRMVVTGLAGTCTRYRERRPSVLGPHSCPK